MIALPIDKSNEDEKEKLESNKEILKKVKSYLITEDSAKRMSLHKILGNLNINPEKYHEALEMSERGKQVILKRKPNECYVNNYNRRFIRAFQANMDLQFCMDAYAVVTYVCDYWSKDETGMTDFLKKALKEAKSWENRSLLSHLKRTYMAKRQVGKCEAIYRAIPSLRLQGSNITCTFVSSGYPENQSKFIRKVQKKQKEERPASTSSSSAHCFLLA